MIKIIYSIFILSFLTLVSCGSSTNTSYSNPHAEPHNQMHQDLINEENQKIIEDLSGNYSGKFPCSDCDYIDYSISLFEDSTFKLTYTYVVKSNAPIEKSGKYILTNRLLIQLNNSANGMNFLRKIPDGLLLLDKNGNEFSKDISRKYKLFPVVSNTNSSIALKKKLLFKKWNSGINFYAFGNEPFWSLDIDIDNNIRVKNLDGLDFFAVLDKPVKAMDADVTRYRTLTEKGEIVVQLSKNKCTDNMSGEIFNYKVDVDIKNTEKTDNVAYCGCGNYVIDPRLHDIWAITEVENTPVISENFKNKFPRLELDTFNNKIIGHDGCNNFHGNFSLEKSNINFEPLASTMMACAENLEISNKIGRVLSYNNLTYKIEANNLILLQNEIIVMQLKHID